MYYDKLRAVWPTVQGADIAERLATLNAMTTPGTPVPVSVSAATNYMRRNGSWYVIKKAADTNLAAFAAVDLVGDLRVETIDFTTPIVLQMGAALVAAGLMTQQQWDGLVALSVTTVPWWQANEYKSPISETDIDAMEANNDDPTKVRE